MRRISFIFSLAAIVAVTAASPAESDEVIEKLQKDQQMADFKVENIYDNEMGRAMGARFRHLPSGFVLDILRIQSIPQGFMWVNSPPPSDQGEPHTCEHLLLGKGTKGRYVASLEDMSLGSSSAFTMQLKTCYHFHTAAGTDVFYDLMEAKLDALINPNFSDEEIRREVANMGYSIDPVDSTLRLEEKGTVYAEMVRSFENPWSNLARETGFLLYGPGHPVSYSSGGYPDAIRTMTPDDMWRFIENTYHLNNMGMIVAIPDDIPLDAFLEETSEILKRVEADARVGQDPATAEDRLPPPKTASAGIIEQSYFPAENEDEPGLLVYAWPPDRKLDIRNELLLELFIANLAGGETSNLYRKFIDSEKRVMDIGANAVFGWLDSDPGRPVYIGFSNVKREATDQAMIDSVRAIIIDEIEAVLSYEKGTPELLAFNERAKNRITEWRRDQRKFLNTPPRFGFRGTGSRWMEHLRQLQKVEGFHKKLIFEDAFRFAEKLLDSGDNFWAQYLHDWHLSDIKPFGVAARANPEMLKASEEARRQRIDAFEADLKDRYGIEDTDEALRKFKDEYDAKTEEIEEEASKIEMPKFVDNPPLTLDDQLHYDILQFPGGGPLIFSTFESMTSATAGLAFDLHVVPESDLLYVSVLPVMLTEVGVMEDGKPLNYDDMIEKIRQEILSLDSYFSVNNRTGRVELMVRGAGTSGDEALKAVEWIERVLFDPDWRPENLPRIRDAVDLYLKGMRNTMKGAEESWVQNPANAYWRQTDPLLLSANSFLTRIHALHRLRWMFKEAGSEETQNGFSGFMKSLAEYGRSANRDELKGMLDLLQGDSEAQAPEGSQNIIAALKQLPETTKSLVKEAANDLNIALTDIPDATLGNDWKYLCLEMAADLKTEPSHALSDLKQVMNLLLRSDNVRGFLVTNTANGKVLIPGLNSLVKRLDNTQSARQTYSSDPVIIDHLKARTPGLEKPVFVGLVNPNTRSGVFINTSDCASYETSDTETLLKFLSARLYGGGGAHSMFMKTWGAGLAYSNGLRSNESTGRLIYYAERCPDLAQTMQFVVNELKNADEDPSLAEYAVAQAFVGNRAGARYEQRGEAMAADLADGLTPDVVREFRENILRIRKDKDLYSKISSRMEATYGEVLPGYGPESADVPGAIYFIIGPEAQFQSYEDYLHGVEGDVTLYRLYPRDYWLTAEN
jgi:Zn-dependent M16 (insulinase) family peptidase